MLANLKADGAAKLLQQEKRSFHPVRAAGHWQKASDPAEPPMSCEPKGTGPPTTGHARAGNGFWINLQGGLRLPPTPAQETRNDCGKHGGMEAVDLGTRGRADVQVGFWAL